MKRRKFIKEFKEATTNERRKYLLYSELADRARNSDVRMFFRKKALTAAVKHSRQIVEKYHKYM